MYAEREDTQKTTVDLPKSLRAEVKRRVALSDDEISMGALIIKALRVFVRSNLDWKDSKKKAVLDVCLSEDPEDLVTFDLPISSIRALFVSSREALRKAGEPLPEE